MAMAPLPTMDDLMFPLSLSYIYALLQHDHDFLPVYVYDSKVNLVFRVHVGNQLASPSDFLVGLLIFI